MFGLDPETLFNIRQAIAKVETIDKVLLYGSRAKGNYRNGSDIDITLLGENLTLENSVYRLMDEIEELYLPYSFDISIFEHIDNTNLKEHIERVGVVFYQRETMKQGWKVKKLGDVCDFVRGPFGGSLKKNIFKSDGCAVYEQQHAIYDQFDDIRYFIDENKFDEMKRFELKSGDLIMSCSGTMGKIAIVPENIKKGIINQALLKLTPSKNISTVFLKLWMQSESFQDSLKEYSGGAAIQNVASVAILKQIEIPLPPLHEQQRIVKKLDALSAETKKLEVIYRKKINDLEELKKSILQKAFRGEL